jgi:hypothetical protein
LRNNPTLIALSEFSSINSNAVPDFVINLGTGSSSQSDTITERPKGFWRSGWLPRLVRAYLSFLHGRRTWNDIICLIRKRPGEDGCYRLDVTLEGTVSFDDTASMPLLRSLVLQDSSLRDVIEELAQRLFAALFYFELTGMQKKSRSRFQIQGQILCIRKAGDPALPHILQRFSRSALLVDGRNVENSLVIDNDGNMQLSLNFTAGQDINIELKQRESSSSFPLSGAPYSVSKLLVHSGLAATFGIRGRKRKADSVKDQSRKRRCIIIEEN